MHEQGRGELGDRLLRERQEVQQRPSGSEQVEQVVAAEGQLPSCSPDKTRNHLAPAAANVIRVAAHAASMRLELRMACWRGLSGNIWWVYTHGAMDEETCKGVVAHLLEYPTTASGRPYLTIAWGSAAPPSSVRKELAEGLRNHEAAFALCPAHAFVTDSMMLRGALTAVGWLVHRPYPEKVFASPEVAIGWLKTLSPEIDPAALVAEMRRIIPADALWLPTAA